MASRKSKSVSKAAAEYAAAAKAQNGTAKTGSNDEGSFARCPSGKHYAYAGGNLCECRFS